MRARCRILKQNKTLVNNEYISNVTITSQVVKNRWPLDACKKRATDVLSSRMPATSILSSNYI